MRNLGVDKNRFVRVMDIVTLLTLVQLPRHGTLILFLYLVLDVELCRFYFH